MHLYPNNKIVILTRGISGCGKSTFAEYLNFLALNSNNSCEICCADDYHMVDGKYTFRAENLGFAHKKCHDKFLNAMKNGVNLIIISNTLTAQKEVKEYLDIAKENGYSVVSLVLENRHNGTNVHSVPQAVLEKQEKRLLSNLKLR